MTEKVVMKGVNMREESFDFLRIVSAFFVIVIHVCAMQWKTLDIHSGDWLTIHVFDMIAKFSVPIFFMVSGRFFLDPDRRLSKEKLKDKILRIIIAFLFWTFVYAVLNILCVIRDGASIVQNLNWIIIEFFSGEYHMWFLYTLIGLYLITPFLRKITENKQLTEYYLILFFIFGLLWPVMEQLPKVRVLFCNAGNAMAFHFAIGYSGYYVLGYYLYKYSPAAIWRKCFYILGILGAVFSVCATLVFSWRIGAANEELAAYLTPNVAFTAAAVYIYAIKKLKNKRTGKVIALLSKYSFGCYLVHPLFLRVFEWIGFVPTLFCPIVSVPVISTVALLLSLGLTILLSKVPYLRKVV